MIVSKEFKFDAAHHLPGYEGKCSKNHGHTYRLKVSVQGEVDSKTGMVIDFGDLSKIVNEHVIDVLDHSDLNNTVDNPTAENVIVWAWEKLDGFVSGLDSLVLWETSNNSVYYDGD